MICVVNKEGVILTDSYQNCLINLKVGDKIFCDLSASGVSAPKLNVTLIHYQSEYKGKTSWNWSSPNLKYAYFIYQNNRFDLATMLNERDRILIDVTTQEHREVTLKSMGI